MNRTDRLLVIMLHVQSRRYTRGEDLAERFEAGVRTIYRDVQALNEAGVPVVPVVPVVSTPGYGYTLPRPAPVYRPLTRWHGTCPPAQGYNTPKRGVNDGEAGPAQA